MPQTQAPSRQVVTMFESRSLVSEAKHDAGLKIQAGSVVESGARFEKTNAAVVEVVDHLKPRFLSSKPRWMKSLGSFLFASSGTNRKQVLVSLDALALPAATPVSWLGASVGFAHAGGLGLLRSPIQSMPSLVQLAAKIVWLVASFSSFGITGRSTGLPSAAR